MINAVKEQGGWHLAQGRAAVPLRTLEIKPSAFLLGVGANALSTLEAIPTLLPIITIQFIFSVLLFAALFIHALVFQFIPKCITQPLYIQKNKQCLEQIT